MFKNTLKWTLLKKWRHTHNSNPGFIIRTSKIDVAQIFVNGLSNDDEKQARFFAKLFKSSPDMYALFLTFQADCEKINEEISTKASPEKKAALYLSTLSMMLIRINEIRNDIEDE